MADASLTNLQMVRPKGPKIFLGVLGLAVAGAAAWWFTRPPGPVGEPEDPGKILVVGPDAADTATTLREFGFTAEHGDYDELATQGAKAATGKEGIEAILHLADTKGFGYVALEDPTSHGMASIKVTGDSADVKADHTWAVFSVGDLGMPPKVTVDIESSVLPLPNYVQVLRAAFKQKRLANTLFAESQLPMDAVELHAKIGTAVELHGAYALIDRSIDKELRARKEAVQDAETVEAKPAVLAGPMETTEVVALGDGTVLSFVQGYGLDMPRDPDVSLQPSAEIELWYHPPGSTEPSERKRCKSLRGGLMAVGGTRHVVSPAADAMLLQSTAGLELWSLDVAAQACAFTRKGKLPRPDGYEHTWGAPHASGKVLRPADPPEGVAVAVWTVNQDQPQMVPMPGCTSIGDPVWLDEGHFAVSCRWDPPTDEPTMLYIDPETGEELAEPIAVPAPPPEQTWIYTVRLADQRIVALPGTALGEHTGLYGLRPVPRGKGLDLIASHPWADKLHRVQGEGDLASLFTEAEPTFVALAEADAAAATAAEETQQAEGAPAAEEAQQTRPVPPAEAPPPAEGAPAAEDTPPAAEEPPAPLLRPAFVPAGSAVAVWPAERLKVSTVELPTSASSISISPDGTRMVFATSDGSHAVRVVPLAGGPGTTVSDNPETTHDDVRFTADGKAVVFTSRYTGTDRSESVGRLAPL